MEYEWILFDIDNTLLDFDGPSKQALKSSCDVHQLEFNEDLYKVYKDVNAKVWSEFEHGKITAIELRPLRFERFFNEVKVNPCSPSKFNKTYLDFVIDYAKDYESIRGTLSALKERYKISVITNGLKEVQRARLTRLNLNHFFDSITVSDEIGVAKPHKAYFDHVFKSIQNPSKPEKTLVVGDSLHSDIKGGNDYGCSTCWLSHGRSNDSEIIPDYTISNIAEFNKIIRH
jgi:YjjG family noncanonical pyrimidine nucleotidase